MTQTSGSSNRPKNWTQIFEKAWFWIPLIVIAFGLPLFMSLRQEAHKSAPVLGQVQDFEAIDQHGNSVHLSDFGGSVLIVNFIFTSCQMVCPLLTEQMAKIQARMIRANPQVKLISISVDPETDTPEVLARYAEKYRADHKIWTFLTGDLATISKAVVEGFKMPMDSEDSSLMDITHGEHFVIIDQMGQIRAYQHARNKSEINELVKTVAILANTRPQAPTLAR